MMGAPAEMSGGTVNENRPNVAGYFWLPPGTIQMLRNFT